MLNISPIKLLAGSHDDTGTTGQGCFMNVIAYLNGEPQITDKSPCVCVTIRPIAIFLNDFADENQRQLLLPFVLRVMDTATDDWSILEKRFEAVVKFAKRMVQLVNELFVRSAAIMCEACARAAKCDANHDLPTGSNLLAASDYAAMAARTAYGFLDLINEKRLLKDRIIKFGLEFLEEACPPLTEPNQEVLSRAACLLSLSEV